MKFKHYVSLTKLSAVIIYEKVTQLASVSGQLLSDYISDPENIRHMSLILYDLLPLSIKITLRHETFYKQLTVLINKLKEPLVIEDPKGSLTNAYLSISGEKKLEALDLPDNFDTTHHNKIIQGIKEGKIIPKANAEKVNESINNSKKQQNIEIKKAPKKQVIKKDVLKD